VSALNGILDWLIRAIAVAACLILAFMTVAISVEVVLRSFFAATLEFTDEYSGYMVLAVCALGVAYCRERNALLTVDFLVKRLSPAARARIEVVDGVAALAFCLMILWYVTGYWFTTIERKLTAATMQQTPLWIPQVLLPFGFLLLCLVIARKLIRPDRHVDDRQLDESSLADLR
jgi:TRAP-type C4-dicarboxylate transport system permease small subunit